MSEPEHSKICCLTELPPLAASAVTVLCLRVSDWLDKARELEDILAANEVARANRFHFSRDRDRYVVQASVTRLVLARVVACRPSKVQYHLGTNGKPILVQSRSSEMLEFNISHSGGVVLLALARGVPVGVDVEEVRPMTDILSVADRHFSTEEARCLRGLPEFERVQMFYRLWTAKEAVLKAMGDGIAERLGEVWLGGQERVEGRGEKGRRAELGARPALRSRSGEGRGSELGTGERGQSALRTAPCALRLVRVPSGARVADDWTLVELEPADGYVGVLAVPAPGIKASVTWLRPEGPAIEGRE